MHQSESNLSISLKFHQIPIERFNGTSTTIQICIEKCGVRRAAGYAGEAWMRCAGHCDFIYAHVRGAEICLVAPGNVCAGKVRQSRQRNTLNRKIQVALKIRNLLRPERIRLKSFRFNSISSIQFEYE